MEARHHARGVGDVGQAALAVVPARREIVRVIGKGKDVLLFVLVCSLESTHTHTAGEERSMSF